jgi:3-chloro-4-hydroxyphenylacetate reductive dehalogenase
MVIIDKNVLHDNRPLGYLPMHKFRNVDKPTNIITNNIKRIPMREIPLFKASFGDYGPAVKQKYAEGKLDPISNSIVEVMLELAPKHDPLASVKKEPIQEDTETLFARKILNFPAINDISYSKNIAEIPEDPRVLTRHIKSLGYFLRADIVSVCEIPEYAWYSHDPAGKPIETNYKYAILIVNGKHLPTVEASNGHDWIADPISYEVYLHSAFIARVVAEYIQNLGYPAYATHTRRVGNMHGGYELMLPPLLLLSGVGEVCRSGNILNPFLGTDYKAAAILTDMPLIPDKPIDFGLQDFCDHCQKCADACPSNAITHGKKVLYNGYETWKLNEKRCTSFNILNPNGSWCLMCTKVCPWTRPIVWQHNMMRYMSRDYSIVRRLAIWTEKYLGHGKVNYDNKWWFDLKKSDGIYRVPQPAINKEISFTEKE